MPLACSARWYTWLRPAEASRGVDDLGAISTSRSGLEIAPRSLTPSEAALGRSHVYQRAEHAKGISLAPGIVPKGQSRRARRTAAHRHQTPPGAPKPTSGGFWRGVTRQYRANRVVSWAVPHPYMMHMLGRGQWARQCSMRSVARLSGEFATSTGCWGGGCGCTELYREGLVGLPAAPMRRGWSICYSVHSGGTALARPRRAEPRE